MLSIVIEKLQHVPFVPVTILPMFSLGSRMNACCFEFEHTGMPPASFF
jgi:hypothetical protein